MKMPSEYIVFASRTIANSQYLSLFFSKKCPKPGFFLDIGHAVPVEL